MDFTRFDAPRRTGCRGAGGTKREKRPRGGSSGAEGTGTAAPPSFSGGCRQGGRRGERVAVLPFRTRPIWAGRRGGWERVAVLFFRTRLAWAGRRLGWEWMKALPFRAARLGRRDGRDGSRWRRCPSGHGPPGRGDSRDGSSVSAAFRTRPAWAGKAAGSGAAGPFGGRRGGFFPGGRLRNGRQAL